MHNIRNQIIWSYQFHTAQAQLKNMFRFHWTHKQGIKYPTKVLPSSYFLTTANCTAPCPSKSCRRNTIIKCGGGSQLKLEWKRKLSIIRHPLPYPLDFIIGLVYFNLIYFLARLNAETKINERKFCNTSSECFSSAVIFLRRKLLLVRLTLLWLVFLSF